MYWLCFLSNYGIVAYVTIPYGLTLARTGGGGCNPPPPEVFSRIAKKTAALRAAGFWATLWGKPCAFFGKKKLTWSGQGTELWS